jgi:anti-sigma B factor antagonist
MTAERSEERLPRRVQRLIDSGVRQLVLDLRGVSYMDSTCLGDIIEVAQALRRYGGRLSLINVPPRVQRLFDISHLTDAATGLVH